VSRSTPEPVIVLHPEGVEIPTGITSLEQFREWVRSDRFPERGRIDWVAGRLEVDMAPEDINTHSSPKSTIAGNLVMLVQKTQRALVCIGSTRISSPTADLSAEPDILVILLSTLESGRARLIPKVSGKEDRYVEIEGSPDLVVECVSDSSTAKDKKLLRDVYHKAGVQEYWIVDARKEDIEFQVLHYQKDGYVPATRDAPGFQRSEVLERKVRLTRARKAAGIVFFRFEVEE
jgi:Uma2 family endonuclease